jgi:hypothetical protein
MRSADIDRHNGEIRPEGAVSDGGGDPPPGADTPVAETATVVDVLRPGYRWRGRLLRPASVVVTGGRR